MKRLWIFGILAIICGVGTSCSKLWPEREWRDKESGYDNVFIHFSLGYNNLTSYLEGNIDEMCSGAVPGRHDGDVVLVLSHTTARAYDYKTPNRPCLYRVYKENGKVVRDTLIRYYEKSISATAGMLSSVLTYVKNEFPSKSYGLDFTSHGTGWLPEGYDYDPEGDGNVSYSSLSARSFPKEPLTKSAGMYATYDIFENLLFYGIEIDDFARAIPMHLDYIIFDACLMGCVEVAYQLKDVCDRIVLSPTEVIARGFDYTNILEHLFNSSGPDLEGVAEDYFKKYSENSYASVCIVDCSGMGNLADVCSGIIDSHRSAFRTIDRSKVQKLFYDDKKWYYDLRDIAVNLGAGGEELARLDDALDRCILYEKHTKKFFQLKLENVCGLSMYIPIASSTKLNTFYRRLAWNKASGLVI